MGDGAAIQRFNLQRTEHDNARRLRPQRRAERCWHRHPSLFVKAIDKAGQKNGHENLELSNGCRATRNSPPKGGPEGLWDDLDLRNKLTALSGYKWDTMGKHGIARDNVITISKSCGKSINYCCAHGIIIHRANP